MSIDDATAWVAFETRDRRMDGRLIVAVTTTGIYCKPSCPARRPRRDNVRFFADPAAARAAGFRACLRCTPDTTGRDHDAVARAVAMITHADGGIALADLAASVGYAPHHFHRLFKRATGVTPAAYARALKARRGVKALASDATVTEAIYDAGYSGASRFYDAAADRLGMTPSAWKRGGAGATIHWTVATTSLGPLLIAATDKGLCRVAFEEDRTHLATRFPKAQIVAGGPALDDLAAQVVAAVETPGRHTDLPIDVQGTAFQEAVWQALRAIPKGETRSYAQIALAAGAPGATRAVGSACGANAVAVVIPCHRVTRSDGGIGGYAYGTQRKRTLLEREAGG
ncbi:MAG: bifunctional DNA-binding transcriptional regulator/O6-methylguanine-DNA methyltransferase Ada [Sphingomonadales bacterium]|nr:bifunctional DNA-binding transcriptional regulator/O6-methylguanine-DNA methyltransferase Ada [Sphingomonadales bacterium]